MKSFSLTNKAKTDLKTIAHYTHKQWGKVQRNTYLKQFDDIFKLLAQSPLSGISCDFIKTGYRKFPYAGHIIFYKVEKNTIKIIRILHKNMDVKLRF